MFLFIIRKNATVKAVCLTNFYNTAIYSPLTYSLRADSHVSQPFDYPAISVTKHG